MPREGRRLAYRVDSTPENADAQTGKPPPEGTSDPFEAFSSALSAFARPGPRDVQPLHPVMATMANDLQEMRAAVERLVELSTERNQIIASQLEAYGRHLELFRQHMEMMETQRKQQEMMFRAIAAIVPALSIQAEDVSGAVQSAVDDLAGLVRRQHEERKAAARQKTPPAPQPPPDAYAGAPYGMVITPDADRMFDEFFAAAGNDSCALCNTSLAAPHIAAVAAVALANREPEPDADESVQTVESVTCEPETLILARRHTRARVKSSTVKGQPITRIMIERSLWQERGFTPEDRYDIQGYGCAVVVTRSDNGLKPARIGRRYVVLQCPALGDFDYERFAVMACLGQIVV